MIRQPPRCTVMTDAAFCRSPPGRRDEGSHRGRCFRGSAWGALLDDVLAVIRDAPPEFLFGVLHLTRKAFGTFHEGPRLEPGGHEQRPTSSQDQLGELSRSYSRG